MYDYEREKEVYNGRPIEWMGRVGLLYPSDYGYATGGGASTDRNTCLNKELYNWFSWSDCFNNDWLKKSSSHWTITSLSSNGGRAFLVSSSGRVNDEFVGYATSIFPVVYLDSNTMIFSGKGTNSEPFELKV